MQRQNRKSFVGDNSFTFRRAQELRSKVIDLSPYLIDSKAKDVHFSIAPNSTHLSQRTQNFLNFSDRESINDQLLQVTINDRAIIFDLHNYCLHSYIEDKKDYLAIRDISDMK